MPAATAQVGSSEENELILTAVLDALHETLLILLRGQVRFVWSVLAYKEGLSLSEPVLRGGKRMGVRGRKVNSRCALL